MQSTDLRPVHLIATEMLRDPALRGRARASATPHLRVLMDAHTLDQVVGFRLARLSAVQALACLRSYPNKTLKNELLDHCNSHCRVIEGSAND